MFNSFNVYPILSANAMNFWGIFNTWSPDGSVFLSLSGQAWGLMLLSAGLVFSWVFLKRENPETLFLACSLTVLAYFFLPTRVHERWLYPFFPFFLVYLSRNNLRLGIVYVFLSVLHLFNLYFGYTYFNNNYLKVSSINQFLTDNFKKLSFLSVAIYLFLCLYLWQKENRQKKLSHSRL